ncbi:MAG TPA: hypothetical protein VFC56_16775 [Stellaceae bacterium]|nr:hypothetical protein [Stellaceae bacterium]
MADETETPRTLRDEAEHLRRLADLVSDERTLVELRKMIEELERRAQELEGNHCRLPSLASVHAHTAPGPLEGVATVL